MLVTHSMHWAAVSVHLLPVVMASCKIQMVQALVEVVALEMKHVTTVAMIMVMDAAQPALKSLAIPVQAAAVQSLVHLAQHYLWVMLLAGEETSLGSLGMAL